MTRLGSLAKKTLNRLFSKFRKEGFLRNIIIVLSGIILARIFILATSPFLTRLYSPVFFGKLGVVISIANILYSMASFKIELIFPLLTTEDKKDKIWQLCFRALFIYILFASFILLLSKNFLTQRYQLGWIEIVSVILMVATSGISEIFKYYHISLKSYKVISFSEVLKSIGQSFIPFIFVAFNLVSIGLVVSELLGRIFGLYGYLKLDWRKLRFFVVRTWDFKFITEHHVLDYLKFATPSRFLNSVSLELVPVIMGYFFGLKFLGFFALAQRMIALPVSLIGRSITDAFYGEASSLYSSGEYIKLLMLLKNIVSRLFLLSLFPSILFFFFAEDLFRIIFGEAWAESGMIVKLLIPFFTFQLMVAPISQIFNVIERQKLSFYWDVIRFIMSIVLLSIFSLVYNNAYYSVLYFSCAMSLVYIGFAVNSFQELKKLAVKV